LARNLKGSSSLLTRSVFHKILRVCAQAFDSPRAADGGESRTRAL